MVAGGWPEPDTMRIVTFPGTLVDVEVWSHPVVWGARMANQVHLRPVDSPLAEIARLGVELAGPRTEAVIVVDLDGRGSWPGTTTPPSCSAGPPRRRSVAPPRR